MNIATITHSTLFVAIILILSVFACDDDEINEASEAFRNCMASSQDTIYRLVAEEKDEDRAAKICTILDSLYTGCKAQIEALEACKGDEHVAKLTETRLYSMQLTLQLTYQNSNVADCKIFKPPKEVKTEPPQTTSSNTHNQINHQSNGGQSRRKHVKDTRYDHNASTLMHVPNVLMFCVVYVLSSFLSP